MKVGFIGLGHMGAGTRPSRCRRRGPALHRCGRCAGCGQSCRTALRCDREKDLRRIRDAAGRQSREAQRQLPARFGDRIARRGHGADGQGRHRPKAISQHPDLDAVRRSRLQDLWRADRRWTIRAGRVRGAPRPQGYSAHPCGRGGSARAAAARQPPARQVPDLAGPRRRQARLVGDRRACGPGRRRGGIKARFRRPIISVRRLLILAERIPIASRRGRRIVLLGKETHFLPKERARIMTRKETAAVLTDRARPLTIQDGKEFQHYGTVARLPIALDVAVCAASVENLNQLLADTMTLRDLYKKHHWQVSGPTFYQLHLLFDKHYEEQNELVDTIAERIQMLGGVSIAMAPDVAETTLIPRPPKGREEAPVQISRLAHAHEIILEASRSMDRQAAEQGSDGTNDLIVSSIIRTNEAQVWFVSEHVVDVPLVHSK